MKNTGVARKVDELGCVVIPVRVYLGSGFKTDVVEYMR